jgi:hypothetical protein
MAGASWVGLIYTRRRAFLVAQYALLEIIIGCRRPASSQNALLKNKIFRRRPC